MQASDWYAEALRAERRDVICMPGEMQSKTACVSLEKWFFLPNTTNETMLNAVCCKEVGVILLRCVETRIR